MLCDEYKDALIEAAAGAVVPVSLREHVSTCARCRATLDAQETLFTMVDAGLRSRTNVGVPTNFDHRVRAALEFQVSPKGRHYFSLLASGSMAVAAVVVLAILLTHNPNHRKQTPPDGVEQAEVSASNSSAVHGNHKELRPSSHHAAHSGTDGLNIPQPSNRAVLGGGSIEVLVPEGQEELLAKYMQGMAAQRSRMVLSVRLQYEPEMRSIEVPPVEILQMAVKPLPDLSVPDLSAELSSK